MPSLSRWLPLVAALLVGLTSCSVGDQGSVGAKTAEGQMLAGLARLEGTATVELRVNGSPIVIEVLGQEAPITAGNFVDLVNKGVYDGTSFHRVVKEPAPFVVQGGDPLSKDAKTSPQALGSGSYIDPATGKPRLIPLEIKPSQQPTPLYGKTLMEAGINGEPQLKHLRGAVAMARAQDPNSASAQFYIALTDLGFLDGNYAVFGRVTRGMDVVDGIKQGDRIESARVTAGLDKLKL
jgi:peptidyl-prolyl cis-trans isomerase B (cyclophilin B)